MATPFNFVIRPALPRTVRIATMELIMVVTEIVGVTRAPLLLWLFYAIYFRF
jgi:hypothetical protein